MTPVVLMTRRERRNPGVRNHHDRVTPRRPVDGLVAVGHCSQGSRQVRIVRMY